MNKKNESKNCCQKQKLCFNSHRRNEVEKLLSVFDQTLKEKDGESGFIIFFIFAEENIYTAFIETLFL